jgi:hypothetical protein
LGAREAFPSDFAFEVFFAAFPLVRPRTFFAGFDWAAGAILTGEGLLVGGLVFDFPGLGIATGFGLILSCFEEDGAAWSSRDAGDRMAGWLLFTGFS